MIQSGLVSVSFRKLTPREIVNLCVAGGLKSIEWGGDVHCPHGDLAKATTARQLTDDAGLAVAAYGSYYRLGAREETLAFESVLASAVVLGAPFVRVWAGQKGSAEADDVYWEAVTSDLREIADLAAGESIGVTLEYHENTLTDSIESTDRLLSAVGHSNVFVNWQPTNYQPFEYSLRGLDAVLPQLSNLHVFRWDYDGRDKIRRPLEEGREDWSRFFEKAATKNGDRYALLEFVKDDSPEQLKADAAALNELLDTANTLAKL